MVLWIAGQRQPTFFRPEGKGVHLDPLAKPMQRDIPPQQFGIARIGLKGDCAHRTGSRHRNRNQADIRADVKQCPPLTQQVIDQQSVQIGRPGPGTSIRAMDNDVTRRTDEAAKFALGPNDLFAFNLRTGVHRGKESAPGEGLPQLRSTRPTRQAGSKRVPESPRGQTITATVGAPFLIDHKTPKSGAVAHGGERTASVIGRLDKPRLDASRYSCTLRVGPP